jgi:hypothetical protein
LETKATICLCVGEYDSVLIYIDSLKTRGFQECAELGLKAKAFSWMNMQDSASIYAHQVLSSHCTSNDSVNMLYILLRDKNIGSDSILSLSYERADRHREYTRSQEKLSHAVEILLQEQKISKGRRIFTIVLIISGLILLVVYIVVNRYRGIKGQQLKQYNQQIVRSQDLIAMHQNSIEEQLTANCRYLRECTDLRKTIKWHDYNAMCNIVNARLFGIVDKLQQRYTDLKEDDIRFCVLVLIDIPYNQMADILNRSPKTIGKRKELEGKKFGVSMKDLHSFLVHLACEIG